MTLISCIKVVAEAFFAGFIYVILKTVETWKIWTYSIQFYSFKSFSQSEHKHKTKTKQTHNFQMNNFVTYNL